MTKFTAHTIESAPDASRPLLEGIKRSFGFVPNLFGVFADIALFFNLCLMLGSLSLLGATLTLPGIAGIALTMGMAVDANVLIYERIREEVRFGTILDSHVTTLVAGFLMFWLGSGPVKGFAVTLSIGVLTSLFSAILVTRLLIVTWLRQWKPKAIPI